MPKYLKVIDEQTPVVQNYLALVLCRGERVKLRVSPLRWIWFCTLEVFFGQELLESFVTTAANSGCPEEPDPNREYGEPNQLNLHIPNGIFTNLFRSQLLQLLYYKFYLQYLLIQPVRKPYEDENGELIDVTRIRFRFRKSLLYLVIPFRRVYLLAAVAINLSADLLAYLFTTNVTVSIFVGIAVEFIRRLLKL